MTYLEIEKEQAGSKGFLRAIYQTRNLHDPLVSVILPVRNREGSVARAISSVLAQTYCPAELIVVDDGSTDNTRKVVEDFGARVTLIAQPHAGVYAARNLGLRR